MKNTLIAGVAAVALASPVYAEIEGDLSLTYNSQFNYRGANGILEDAAAGFGADTENTFDTELNLRYSLNDQWSLFGGVNIHTLSDTSVDHDRYRLGAIYTGPCCTLEIGYQQQDLRTVIGSIDSSEIYVNIGKECPLTGGNVNLLIAHDLDELEGTYAELSLNKTWDLCEKSKLDVTAGVSYSFDYWDEVLNTGSDWNHAYLTVAMPYTLTDDLTLTPFVTFSQGFGALDPSGTTLEEDGEIVWGVSASVNF